VSVLYNHQSNARPQLIVNAEVWRVYRSYYQFNLLHQEVVKNFSEVIHY